MSDGNSSSSNFSWFWFVWVVGVACYAAWVIYDYSPAPLGDVKAVVTLAESNLDAAVKVKSFLAEDSSPSRVAVKRLHGEVNAIITHEFAVSVAGESAVKQATEEKAAQDRAMDETKTPLVAALESLPEWAWFLFVMLPVAIFGAWFVMRDSN